jgi:hypothetical protein
VDGLVEHFEDLLVGGVVAGVFEGFFFCNGVVGLLGSDGRRERGRGLGCLNGKKIMRGFLKVGGGERSGVPWFGIL